MKSFLYISEENSRLPKHENVLLITGTCINVAVFSPIKTATQLFVSIPGAINKRWVAFMDELNLFLPLNDLPIIRSRCVADLSQMLTKHYKIIYFFAYVDVKGRLSWMFVTLPLWPSFKSNFASYWYFCFFLRSQNWVLPSLLPVTNPSSETQRIDVIWPFYFKFIFPTGFFYF